MQNVLRITIKFISISLSALILEHFYFFVWKYNIEFLVHRLEILKYKDNLKLINMICEIWRFFWLDVQKGNKMFNFVKYTILKKY